MSSACENPKNLAITNFLIYAGLYVLTVPGTLYDFKDTTSEAYKIISSCLFGLLVVLFSYFITNNQANVSPTAKTAIFILVIAIWYIILSPVMFLKYSDSKCDRNTNKMLVVTHGIIFMVMLGLIMYNLAPLYVPGLAKSHWTLMAGTVIGTVLWGVFQPGVIFTLIPECGGNGGPGEYRTGRGSVLISAFFFCAILMLTLIFARNIAKETKGSDLSSISGLGLPDFGDKAPSAPMAPDIGALFGKLMKSLKK